MNKQHHHHKSSSLSPVFTIITTIISNVICNYLFIIFTLVLFQGLFEPSYTFFTLIVLHILFFLVLSYLILVWFGTSWWSVTLSIFVFACGQVRNPRLIASVFVYMYYETPLNINKYQVNKPFLIIPISTL